MYISYRGNIFAVKWGKKCSTSIMVEFSGHKMKNPNYSNQKTESGFVISMSENPLVFIFMSFVEVLTKPKPNQTEPELTFHTLRLFV